MADTLKPKVRKVCRHCGSDNVTNTAEAGWDTEAQRWILLTLYDDATCNDCDGETRIEDAPIADPPESREAVGKVGGK